MELRQTPTFAFEHDAEKGIFRLTWADGKVEVFRDKPARHLVVEPDPETGEMKPVVKCGKPDVLVDLPRGTRDPLIGGRKGEIARLAKTAFFGTPPFQRTANVHHAVGESEKRTWGQRDLKGPGIRPAKRRGETANALLRRRR